MRIIEEYTDTNADLIDIMSANYIGDFATNEPSEKNVCYIWEGRYPAFLRELRN